MLYVVEIRRGQDDFSKAMARIREWLDAQHYEPDGFRCSTDDAMVTCRLEFKDESEAVACARAFSGEMRSLGYKAAG
jgi:hypothetical protein